MKLPRNIWRLPVDIERKWRRRRPEIYLCDACAREEARRSAESALAMRIDEEGNGAKCDYCGRDVLPERPEPWTPEDIADMQLKAPLDMQRPLLTVKDIDEGEARQNEGEARQEDFGHSRI